MKTRKSLLPDFGRTSIREMVEGYEKTMRKD
jgi:hypothetical protein